MKHKVPICDAHKEHLLYDAQHYANRDKLLECFADMVASQNYRKHQSRVNAGSSKKKKSNEEPKKVKTPKFAGAHHALTKPTIEKLTDSEVPTSCIPSLNTIAMLREAYKTGVDSFLILASKVTEWKLQSSCKIKDDRGQQEPDMMSPVSELAEHLKGATIMPKLREMQRRLNMESQDSVHTRGQEQMTAAERAATIMPVGFELVLRFYGEKHKAELEAIYADERPTEGDTSGSATVYEADGKDHTCHVYADCNPKMVDHIAVVNKGSSIEVVAKRKFYKNEVIGFYVGEKTHTLGMYRQAPEKSWINRQLKKLGYSSKDRACARFIRQLDGLGVIVNPLPLAPLHVTPNAYESIPRSKFLGMHFITVAAKSGDGNAEMFEDGLVVASKCISANDVIQLSYPSVYDEGMKNKTARLDVRPQVNRHLKKSLDKN